MRVMLANRWGKYISGREAVMPHQRTTRRERLAPPPPARAVQPPTQLMAVHVGQSDVVDQGLREQVVVVARRRTSLVATN